MSYVFAVQRALRAYPVDEAEGSRTHVETVCGLSPWAYPRLPGMRICEG
jgi:hypothetical protein